MNKEILVDANAFETRVAVVEDGTPVELYIEQEGNDRLVGNVYLGRVENVLPGMQAAFVDIGQPKNAFLYVGDVVIPGDAYDELPGVPEKKKITDFLKAGQSILVQVAKDPQGSKGARVTTHLTLAGRNLVLMPTMDYVGVSKRIDADSERKKVREIATAIKPKGMGIIVRTAASEANAREVLREDLDSLTTLYDDIQKKAARLSPPALLHAEQALLVRVARDILMRDVDRVFVNEQNTYENLRALAERMAPKLVPRILYKPGEALFDRYGTEGKIDTALSRKVWLKSGGYLIIDRTEALTVIDVNSGRFVGKDNLEKTITITNTEAAQEIAKQLRLRDIGGIIVVDFIDMDKEQNRRLILQTMKDALKPDHTHSRVFGFTHLGLMEITRKKTGRSIGDTLKQSCPHCEGEAKLATPLTVFGRLRKQCLITLRGSQTKRLYVEAHPDVVAVMEELYSSHGSLFPESVDCVAFVRGNAALHEEKFSVKPVAMKRVAEYKKNCKIMH
ncbi:MAG: Rne/Rng family ribonuclease [Clostridiales bacterium]|nr:Rne/Rng family ribonuclease [Clostridiales bacterium]